MTTRKRENPDVVVGDVVWDSAKDEYNQRVHGYAFIEAYTVFNDPNARSDPDPIHSGEELRWRTIGYTVNNNLLRVCHTIRNDRFRLINAYPPTPSERKLYEEQEN